MLLSSTPLLQKSSGNHTPPAEFLIYCQPHCNKSVESRGGFPPVWLQVQVMHVHANPLQFPLKQTMTHLDKEILLGIEGLLLLLLGLGLSQGRQVEAQGAYLVTQLLASGGPASGK